MSAVAAPPEMGDQVTHCWESGTFEVTEVFDGDVFIRAIDERDDSLTGPPIQCKPSELTVVWRNE